MNEPSSPQPRDTPPFWRSRAAIGLLVMGAVAWTRWVAPRALRAGALPCLSLRAYLDYAAHTPRFWPG